MLFPAPLRLCARICFPALLREIRPFGRVAINFLIEHQCPQCGGPIVLEETDRLFTCEFCRVRSFLVQRGSFQYVFADKAPGGQELLFFPYWRFKGMFFACTPAGVKHKFMDLSYQAVETNRLPVSVGLRSQALKLRFVTPKTEGRFLPPSVSLTQVMEMFDQRFSSGLPKPIVHQTHIGESLSLIYAPFYLDGKLHDAVLNRPVPGISKDEAEALFVDAGKPRKHIQFLPTLCPSCGWDLTGKRDSLVLQCRNCDTAWQGGKSGLQQIPFAHLPLDAEPLVFMPFWRVRAEVSDLALDTYADLVKVANLPRAVQQGWDKIGFRFWAPAFKVRPQTFIRLLTSITLAQPKEEPEKRLPKGSIHPVNLLITEAIESLKINLATFMKPRRRVMSLLPEVDIRAKSFMLVYVPFVEKHHDLVHPVFQTAINKNQLRLSNNL
ncbi:MAG: hypothetical protein K9K88_08775 [Desulfobacterales bacterium]|nr:hypothetical protein [Desulfobacterales bacterium]